MVVFWPFWWFSDHFGVFWLFRWFAGRFCGFPPVSVVFRLFRQLSGCFGRFPAVLVVAQRERGFDEPKKNPENSPVAPSYGQNGHFGPRTGIKISLNPPDPQKPENRELPGKC